MSNGKSNKVNGCLIAVIVVVSLFAIVLMGAVFILFWLGSSMGSEAEHGVLMGSKVDAATIAYIEEQEILNPSEEIVVFYDYTMNLDASEAGLLTNERIIYYNKQAIEAIDLEDVTKVNHYYENLGGDFIEITDQDGNFLVIEVAPFNEGEMFYNALKSSLEAKGIDAEGLN